MGNRIKEKQLMLLADQTRSAKIRANQLRLYFSSIASLLMQTLRKNYEVLLPWNGTAEQLA
jgi:hypothetical protein